MNVTIQEVCSEQRLYMTRVQDLVDRDMDVFVNQLQDVPTGILQPAYADMLNRILDDLCRGKMCDMTRVSTIASYLRNLPFQTLHFDEFSQEAFWADVDATDPEIRHYLKGTFVRALWHHWPRTVGHTGMSYGM